MLDRTEPGPESQGDTAPQPRQPALVNPISGVPWSDLVRDGSAAALLLTALGTAWDRGVTSGGEHWWVVLSVLFALGSLGVPYLLAARAVPAIGPHESQLLKLGLNVPLLLSVLIVFMVSAANFDDVSEGYVGPAVAFALTGSVLAMQPRKVEHGSPYVWWVRAPRIVGALALAGLLAGTVFWLLDDLLGAPDVDVDLLLDLLAIVSGGTLVVLLMFGPSLLALGRASFAANRVYAVLGLGYLATMAVSLLGEPDGFFYPQCVEKLAPLSGHDGSVLYGYCGTGGTAESLLANYPLGALVLLLPVSAALAVARPTLALLPAGDRVADWVSVAARALMVYVAVAGAYVVHLTLLLVLIVRHDDVRVSLVVRVVTLLVAIVVAMVTRALLGDPARNRGTVVLLSGALMVLALVNAIVGHESNGVQHPSLGLVFGFVLPGLVAYSLVVPSEVRRAFGSLLPAPPNPGPEG